jgi:hypothetical protein
MLWYSTKHRSIITADKVLECVVKMIWDEIKIGLEEGECFDKKQIVLTSNLKLTNRGVLIKSYA